VSPWIVWPLAIVLGVVLLGVVIGAHERRDYGFGGVAVLALAGMTLGLWKLIEVIAWVVQHVRVSW
jgi:uncharacterized membrane protein